MSDFVTRCDLLWPGGYLAISACCSVVFGANHVKVCTRTKQNTEIILLLSKVVQFRDQEGAVVTRCDQMLQNCIFGPACPTGVQDHSFWPPWHAGTEFFNLVWPACDQVWPDAANLNHWNCLTYSGPSPKFFGFGRTRTRTHLGFANPNSISNRSQGSTNIFWCTTIATAITEPSWFIHIASIICILWTNSFPFLHDSVWR